MQFDRRFALPARMRGVSSSVIFPCMSRVIPALALFLVLACSGCATPREHWVYGLSREAYFEGDSGWFNLDRIGAKCGTDPKQLMFIPAMFLFPFVIDTVLLPITIPRDLYVYR